MEIQCREKRRETSFRKSPKLRTHKKQPSMEVKVKVTLPLPKIVILNDLNAKVEVI